MNDNPNTKTSATQCSQIKDWLMQGKTITSLEALNLFGCMRLASRIHDLRVMGMKIIAEKIQVPSGKYVTRYALEL